MKKKRQIDLIFKKCGIGIKYAEEKENRKINNRAWQVI